MARASAARTSRQEQVEQRRAELLEAARQVVLERGLSHTRVADVAAATKVSGGLIHYHFATKDVLLTEMLRHEAERDIAKARRLATGSGDPLQRLDRVMREFVPSSRNDQTWVLWIDAWGAGLRDETLRSISEELDAAWNEMLFIVITRRCRVRRLRHRRPARRRRPALGPAGRSRAARHAAAARASPASRCTSTPGSIAELELGLAPGSLAAAPPADRRRCRRTCMFAAIATSFDDR